LGYFFGQRFEAIAKGFDELVILWVVAFVVHFACCISFLKMRANMVFFLNVRSAVLRTFGARRRARERV
jgi:hypothetical protein